MPYPGHVEIYPGLGTVSFDGDVLATEGILVRLGSGLKVHGDLSAGGDIKARWCIRAGGHIQSGGSIEAGWNVSSGWDIMSEGFLWAGSNISAGWGISAGKQISCKTLSAGLRIFSGVSTRKLATAVEPEVRVQRLASGTIAFGKLVLLTADDRSS